MTRSPASGRHATTPRPELNRQVTFCTGGALRPERHEACHHPPRRVHGAPAPDLAEVVAKVKAIAQIGYSTNPGDALRAWVRRRARAPRRW
ncbi:hypothetical protein AB0M36_08170 [Actinoplanes sp. NPDC051346]|uniref:hypothetical protein n=1 Tax=Actinoplanes sp. NPDC051346 TaxID=3155048 RepID=UPI003434BCB0